MTNLEKLQKPKLKTQLEAAGAEYLVLGELLRRRIQAFITSQNFEAYDIVAVNPENNKNVRIQVKSRFSDTDCGFPIKKKNADFVVFVRLNIKKLNKENEFDYSNYPEIFILPMAVVQRYKSNDGWEKCLVRKIPNYSNYINNWELIKKKLKN